ncbi:hypothetical protein AVEN_189426-1, partial [Araneus ventricosus]
MWACCRLNLSHRPNILLLVWCLQPMSSVSPTGTDGCWCGAEVWRGFVREACIFAMAAVFTSVPGFLLFSDDMTSLVLESKEWLQ